VPTQEKLFTLSQENFCSSIEKFDLKHIQTKHLIAYNELEGTVENAIEA
jgi:hypothetical protein